MAAIGMIEQEAVEAKSNIIRPLAFSAPINQNTDISNLPPITLDEQRKYIDGKIRSFGLDIVGANTKEKRLRVIEDGFTLLFEIKTLETMYSVNEKFVASILNYFYGKLSKFAENVIQTTVLGSGERTYKLKLLELKPQREADPVKRSMTLLNEMAAIVTGIKADEAKNIEA